MADDIVVEHVFSVCRNRRELKPYLCIVSDQTHQLKLAADALRGIGLDIKMQHLFKFIPAGEAAMDEMTQPACGGVPMLFPGDPLQA
jgi:hypothetical protein